MSRVARLLPLLLAALPAAADGTPTNTVLRAGDRAVLEYRHDPAAFKAYVAQLHTPAGVAVLRDSPHDHVHHHALMFALGAGGVNFWEERAECGRQVQQPPALEAGGLAQRLDWTGKDGVVRLVEDRSIRLKASEEVTLVTWTSRLQPPAGVASVELTGSHYYGLGARFVTSMDAGATFLFPEKADGAAVRGTEKLTPARWCAVTGLAGDKPVTFAIFDAPSNPRHPAQMFTMTAPFAYLSATMNLWKQPMVLKAGETLPLTYGVALWEGRRDAGEIERAWQDWRRGL